MRDVDASLLRAWAARAFVTVGMHEAEAAYVAGCLVQTSLWGIDSHGIARIPHYLERLTRRSINPRPSLRFTKTAAAVGTLDGDDGIGFVVCGRAMEEAVQMAKDAGVAFVGVGRSSHCGSIGLYTRQAARAGLIGMAFTHSDSFVTPQGGDRAFFGTNPISIAMPRGDESRPLCVDMATSVVPLNKIMNARRDKVPLEPGWAIDAQGRPTTDAECFAALRPMAAHKGYALAFLIDMLCGPLNGMFFGPHLTRMYSELDSPRRLGSLMIAINPACFPGGASLRSEIDVCIGELKAMNPAILYPGEPEYLSEVRRSADGIPVEPKLVDELASWSDLLGIPVLF